MGAVTFTLQNTSRGGAEQGSIAESHADEEQVVETISVDTERGDELVSSGHIAPPNVVKMDIEGEAPRAITGLRRSLAADQCRLVYVEPHENSTEIREQLQGLGFEVETIALDGHGEPTLVGQER